MSTLFVKVVKIQDIVPHGNADALEVAKIAGWECIVKKSQFKVGDLAIYVPIDSRIPYSLEERLFKNSKLKLDHGRIKTIKLRGRVSQGLLIKPEQVPELGDVSAGQDVAEALGVTKYEPPEPGAHGVGPKGAAKRRKATPGFIRYTNIENIKWYNEAFEDGDLVAITEKLHGTSARFTLGKREPKNLWQKLQKFFGKDLGLEVICGTRETEHGADDKFSTWAKVARQYCLETKLSPGEIVFGEIVGYKIQKGYDYGYSPDHHGFFVYDVQVTEAVDDLETEKRFLSHNELIDWCEKKGLQMVPILHEGPFSQKVLKECTQGPSILDPKNPTREGCVVRPIEEGSGPSSGRRVLKSINPDYAEKDQTEFH